MEVDVAIVGGGPAGLAVAIEAATRGLAPLLIERRLAPPDKACGEGLMPQGVRALEALGVVGRLDPLGCSPFVGIRYVQEDGGCAAARFREGPGLGIRRTALVEAMASRAREAGALLQMGNAVHGFRQRADEVELDTDGGPVRARLLVVADGLASPLRRAAGLERGGELRSGRSPGARRFGVRRHYALQPWSDHVEIHWAQDAEAYVTPAGPGRIGVALLWDEAKLGPQRFDRLIQHFPLLRQRLESATVDSGDRGAGPLARAVRGRAMGRVVLVGDAAGYLDALSGEGLSLAFQQAASLGALLHAGVAEGGRALARYELETARAFRRYVWITSGLLLLSRHPALRRRVIHGLARYPSIFAQLLAFATRAR